MKGITKYYSGKILIAIKITGMTNGSIPITSPLEALQIVSLKHKKGSYLKAHMHAPKRRVTERLQECLFIKKGRVKIDLYTREKKYIKSLLLNEGQLFLTLNGGLGIHVTKDCEMFEFKNGPFIEDKVLI